VDRLQRPFQHAYYNVLFDRAADELFAAMGMGPDYISRTGFSYFTLETHTTYVRELHAGDSVLIHSRILDHDAKRVHYVQQMVHETGGWLACVLEVIVSHIDMAAKKTSPYPPDVAVRIEAMAAEHKDLPIPPQVGHRIAIRR
jgi:acyl-CoA thioester hydrolase